MPMTKEDPNKESDTIAYIICGVLAAIFGVLFVTQFPVFLV